MYNMYVYILKKMYKYMCMYIYICIYICIYIYVTVTYISMVGIYIHIYVCIYILWDSNIAVEAMNIEFVDLPLKNAVFP